MGGSAGIALAEDVAAARRALAADYRQKLDELAVWCEAQGQNDLARHTRQWFVERDPTRLYFFDPPASMAEDEPADPHAEAFTQWQTKFRALRTAQANSLFTLARRAIKQHRPSLTSELVLETVRENPDHEHARLLLGFVKHDNVWRTPFEVRQLNDGKVRHEQFGWLRKAHVERYDRGERFYLGRWVTADAEVRLRADIARAWRVESDHYVVMTNHSLEEGVRLSRRLERLYLVWKTAFPRYLASEPELARRFDGRSPLGRDPRRHNVTYFRSRGEYNQALRAKQPQIDITLGLYLDPVKTVYFFADKEQDPGTVYHEATHQLFQETQPVSRTVGERDNFWIIEAIACYMESLEEHPGYCTLGGFEAARTPAARVRLLVDNFYVPLAELVGYSRQHVQHDPSILKLYSQAAGMAAFLMQYGEGQYREPLAEYLVRVYTGRVDRDTLAQLTGSSYAELDHQYRQFLESAGKLE